MPSDYTRIWPIAFAALAMFVIYRRLRRNFGRQVLSPTRMALRITVLAVLACALAPSALRSSQFLLADLVGLGTGIALGLYGAERTRFQTVSGRLHYVPHTYTGIAVSLLLMGRLVYRLVAVYGGSGRSSFDATNATDMSQTFSSSALAKSPLTLGMLYVVIGYYVCYFGVVLWKSKRIGPEDIEVISTSNAAG
jgi:hypothetical protein